jgi:hypothetical protein
MARTTVITHPDGTTTRVVTSSGCGGCLSGAFWTVVVLYVLCAPAAYFPVGLMVPAYILEAIIVIAAVATWLQRRNAGQ